MINVPLTILSETTPIAAKCHSCNVCSCVIRKGEAHQKIVYHDPEALSRHRSLISVRFHFHCPKD